MTVANRSVQALREALAAIPQDWEVESSDNVGCLHVYDPNGDGYGYVFTHDRATVTYDPAGDRALAEIDEDLRRMFTPPEPKPKKSLPVRAESALYRRFK